MTIGNLLRWVRNFIEYCSIPCHRADIVQYLTQSLLLNTSTLSRRQPQQVLDGEGRIVGIGRPCATFFRWIEAKTTVGQVHALEPLIPHQNGRLIVTRYLSMI